jgi:hypothetical protein
MKRTELFTGMIIIGLLLTLVPGVCAGDQKSATVPPAGNLSVPANDNQSTNLTLQSPLSANITVTGNTASQPQKYNPRALSSGSRNASSVPRTTKIFIGPGEPVNITLPHSSRPAQGEPGRSVPAPVSSGTTANITTHSGTRQSYGVSSVPAITAVDDGFSGEACYVDPVWLGNVLDNDYPHEDIMQSEIVEEPSHGYAFIVYGSDYFADGVLGYYPAWQGYGEDSLKYRVFNGYEYSNVATVSISILRSSYVVDGINMTLNTEENTPVEGSIPSAAPWTMDYQDESFRSLHGTVVIHYSQTLWDVPFTYTPDPGFVGTDSFSYVIDTDTFSCGDFLGEPGTVTINVGHAVPVIVRMGPVSAVAGNQGFTLTLAGTGYYSGSVVRWNGANRSTTFVPPHQLKATITADDIAAPGIANITVFNGEPGGGVSNTQIVTIIAKPLIQKLGPNSVRAKSPGFNLSVNGTNFLSTCTVQWNGTTRDTTYVSRNSLTAVIIPSDVGTPGTMPVTVSCPGTNGGTSSPVPFYVRAVIPTISGIAPGSAAAGTTELTLTVNGTGFSPSSQVQWNGKRQATTFVSPDRLTARIDMDLVLPGRAIVTVLNPDSLTGARSNSIAFVVRQIPTVTGITPGSAIHGSPGFSLTVNGSYFLPASVVQWNGKSRNTTFLSSGELSAAITAADILTAGRKSVNVINPGLYGGTSGVVNFTVS